MKTLIAYVQIGDETRFFLTDGDRSELNGCIANATEMDGYSAAIRSEVANGAENEHWSEVQVPLRLPLQEQEIIVVYCGIFL